MAQDQTLQAPTGGAEAPRGRWSTLFGATGLIRVPTASVTPRGSFSFGTYFAKDYDTISLIYGIYDSIEVGGVYVERDGADEKGIATAKIRIVPANLPFFELGIGVIDPADAIDDTGYIIASAQLTNPAETVPDAVRIRLHAGVGTGMYQEDLIGGAEVFFGTDLSLVGEYDSKDVNAAIRYLYDENFAIQAGVMSKRGFIGVSYRLQF